jgi:hypothetical protein
MTNFVSEWVADAGFGSISEWVLVLAAWLDIVWLFVVFWLFGGNVTEAL